MTTNVEKFNGSWRRDIKPRNNGADFENQIDDWYKENNVVSKLITSTRGDTTYEKKEDEVHMDPEWERQNLRFGWGKWTPE
jgi:hypothetical protein